MAKIACVSGLSALVFLLAGCGASTSSSSPSDESASRSQHSALSMAKHVAGARMAALAGDQQAVKQNVRAMQRDFLRDARIPDPARPIAHEAARAAVAPITGVRSVVWIDHANLLVMVGGAQCRNTAMIDRVCDALDPLGDTLAVVVNVQDVTATTSEGADAVFRNCQLPKGQRAFLQPKRQIEALDPATRKAFKAQQDNG